MGVEVLGKQLLRVSAGRGEPETGRADVGHPVVLGDVAAVARRVRALHLQLGRDTELQGHPQARAVRVDVRIDQPGQERCAVGIDDLRITWHLVADRLDDAVVDHDRLLAEVSAAVEDSAGDDCSAHVEVLQSRSMKAARRPSPLRVK